jgi:sugar lactone lactonase YvrE
MLGSRILASLLAAAALVLPVVPARSAGVPGVDAPGYGVSYLVPPNPLPATNGLRVDPTGRYLFIAQAFFNRVSRMDLQTGEIVRIADDTDGESSLQAPDDLAIDADGLVYATTVVGRNVTRFNQDGSGRTVVGSNITNGLNGPNGISFDPDTGRLYATDLFFDPNHPEGGLWEIDKTGALPPRPIARGLAHPEGFGIYGGKAYIPEFYKGTIDEVDLATGLSTQIAGGFGTLVALDVDNAGRLVTLETSTGKIWRLNRDGSGREVIAEGEVGFDNAAVNPVTGDIYVSNFVRGGIRKVDLQSGTLKPLVEGPLSIPVTLNEGAGDSLLVGDGTSIVRVQPDGAYERVNRFLLDHVPTAGPIDNYQLATPGAIEQGGTMYFTDFLPTQDDRISRRDADGTQSVVARGVLWPWHIRSGPAGPLAGVPEGHLLVTDEGAGTVLSVDANTGLVIPVAAGLSVPGGLAYDAASNTAYVSSSGSGEIYALKPFEAPQMVIASGLSTPEGVALDGDGGLLVVEAGTGSLWRYSLGDGSRTLVASGLPTKITGVTGIPNLNFTSDVLVLDNGDIIVSGTADASLIRLHPLA